jgi:hypothetical protein
MMRQVQWWNNRGGMNAVVRESLIHLAPVGGIRTLCGLTWRRSRESVIPHGERVCQRCAAKAALAASTAMA